MPVLREGGWKGAGPQAYPLARKDSGIWTDSPLPRLHTWGKFPVRQLGGFCQKRGGAGPANAADVRSGLLHRGCAIETKQARGWFPGAPSRCLTRDCSPEHSHEARTRGTQQTCAQSSARSPRRAAGSPLAPHRAGLLWACQVGSYRFHKQGTQKPSRGSRGEFRAGELGGCRPRPSPSRGRRLRVGAGAGRSWKP